MNIDKTVYEAESRIEADAWIASTGKRRYAGFKLEVKQHKGKFLVIKKVS